MSGVYLLTGRLGSGKSLGAVHKAVEYAAKGRRVVANFPIDFAPVSRSAKSKLAHCSPCILPARPTAAQLEALGDGGPDEDHAGLLILDECGTFLNARTWAGDERQKIIEWMLHSRKRGWEIMLLIQHQSMLDKQVREALCEYLVTFRRLDKFRFPVIGWMLPKLPRVHVGQVRYGLGLHDPTADHWIFRGGALFECYDTKWVSTIAHERGPYSVLPAQLSKHRYEPPGLVTRISAWIRGDFAKPRRPAGPSPRLAPLLRLPPELRWQAARRLVSQGYL